MPTFSADTLTEFAAQLLSAGGLSDEEAALVARSLVGANSLGYDSHGVMRIPFYLDGNPSTPNRIPTGKRVLSFSR